ncbi:MAG: DUF2796 domain-containing protein [Pseudomonadales bacterium]|jgi:hypothetical protein|nr:DUF2796 domain-containing protein [Pseudomonadales bacterium]
MKIHALIKPLVVATAITLPLLATADEHMAHVHGAAKLQVAIDGSAVTLMLESPMDSLVGFEHAPGNEAEKAALARLVAALEKPDALFVFSPAAGCASSSTKLESPLIADESHDHKHEEKHEEKHSDLDGEFSFVCKEAGKLTQLTVNLFDVAANLQDLDVEIAAPRGQTAAELKPDKRTVTW